MFGDIRKFNDLSVGCSCLMQMQMLPGLGSGEEWTNDTAATVAFGTFKGQEDHTRAVLGNEYYVDAFKAITDSADFKQHSLDSGEALKQAGVEAKMLEKYFKGD
mmetsp:Transcript_75345/g.201904  ORF Transcript_75345/g.201904 Transcript_75345/m.201904 type:complete len:104 (+) Transcript_75345:38-349(+)